jgi:hypothetical protein
VTQPTTAAIKSGLANKGFVDTQKEYPWNELSYEQLCGGFVLKVWRYSHEALAVGLESDDSIVLIVTEDSDELFAVIDKAIELLSLIDGYGKAKLPEAV